MQANLSFGIVNKAKYSASYVNGSVPNTMFFPDSTRGAISSSIVTKKAPTSAASEANASLPLNRYPLFHSLKI